jgi:BirA family transcriptional regulator, biotin operon repressor / biotin---[acetyl-CoA-carboxylase] ligase
MFFVILAVLRNLWQWNYMKHIHRETIDSTSDYLKSNFKDLISHLGQIDQEILITTRHQTKGRGRLDHEWKQLGNSLAFSFLIRPCEILTLTSIEIGILLNKYFKDRLYLKWPNDILNSKLYKCGGILCQLVSKKYLIVGVGINYGNSNKDNFQFPYPVGSVFENQELEDIDYQNIPKEIYRYILDNRMKPKKVISEWDNCCVHKDQDVKIIDGETSTEGIFKKINQDGAAILDIKGVEKAIMCGSLFITLK